MENIERVEHDGKLLAIVIRKDFNKKGLTFVTEDEFGLQVGVHIQDKGFEAKPHKHLPFEELRDLKVQEMFYVKKGRIKIGLYDDEGKKIRDVEGNAGDTLILNSGHSFLCLEDSKFIEIKQGPYSAKKDKSRFKAISDSQIKLPGSPDK